MSEYDEPYYERAQRSGIAGAVAGLVASIDVMLMARNLSSKGRGGRLLEIGLGDGSFLSAMAKRGWDAWGIDISEAAVAMARARVGIKVDLGDILEKPYEDDFFDMVVMRHVLEHLKDPAAALSEVHRILKPDGELCVVVPNIESIEAKIGGESWFHLDPEYHLSHFSSTTLTEALTLAGFRDIRLSQMLLGYRQTLTYAIMSRIGLEARPGECSPLPLWRRILLYVMLPFGVLLSFAFSLVRRGGTMQAIARK